MVDLLFLHKHKHGPTNKDLVTRTHYRQRENTCAIYRRCQLVRFTGCLTSTAAVTALAKLKGAEGAWLDVSIPPSGVSLKPLADPGRVLSE